MRARVVKDSLLGHRAAFLGACGACALAIACVREERNVAIGPQQRVEPPSSAPAPPSGLAQYLIADPSSSRSNGVALPLGPRGVHGLVVDKRRVVVGQGEPRVAPDATTETILGASRVPGRFGGGFLFWTSSTIYRAAAFDAKLVPVTRVLDSIDSVSFAPKSLLVRTHNGERWGVSLPSGERAPIAPLGVADIQALDDGRAIAFSDQGTVFTSTDHGARWTDATAQVKSSPAKVSILAGDVWLVESNGGASRLELDGHLSWFDKMPSDPAAELRPRDPRWRGAEAPIRTALRAGAAIDDGTALVIESGDVVRIDVHTGEVISVTPGRLPPDAHCEAVPTVSDVLFACVSHAGGSAFVVSHTLASSPPTLEQTFIGGGQFFAGDDGGLAYAGSCQGVPPGPADVPVVCVRTPSGTWEEHDVSGLASDGGAPDVNVARWVPRQDGHVVALVVEPSPGIYDPQLQTFQPLADDAREILGRGALPYGTHPGKYGRPVRYRRLSLGGIVDTSWSFGRGTTLRGWQRQGESVEISDDGKLTRSPYSFEVVYAGALGLGRSSDGRLYQSSDHGASWVEVATPPSGAESLDLVSCTTAGCDLGSFYRVGWAIRPPRIEPPKQSAPAAAEVRRVRGVELACRPQGTIASKVLPRTGDSPDDLGLGVARLPVAYERSDFSFVRNPIARGIVSPIHDPPNGESDSNPSLRGLLSGYGTSRDGDTFTVAGPNKNPMALRRALSYVAPFDPLGRIVRTSIAMSDVVAAGRRAGMTTDEILAEDFTESGTIVTLTSADPGAPSDIALHNVDHGLLTLVRGERVRVAIRAPQNSAMVVSGVVLAGTAGATADEAAFLEVESSGVGHVFKVGPAGASDLFDISPTGNETFYPANPDALAVNAKGELAVIRTPSGSDPPSAFDPAFLIVPAMPPAPLAPWSELKLADDPACKAEPGGWRAAIQMMAPWIRVTTPELRVDESPMIARVRWTPTRVCLEGFEVRGPSVNVRVAQAEGGFDTASVATWLVGKGSTFARVGVTDGIEWRQALECSIVTTGP